jgi:hypothetical protein
MSVNVLRNHAELVGACASFEIHGRTFSDYCFENFPVLSLSASEAIDGVASSRAVAVLQSATRRFYALLKYGYPRRLRKKERAEARIDVRHFDGDSRLEIDFTGPMNAALLASSRRAAELRWPEYRRLAAYKQSEVSGGSEGPWRTARECLLRLIDGLEPPDKRLVLMFAITLFAGVVGSGLYFKEATAYQLGALDRNHSHQLKMAELEHTTIVTHTGGPVVRNGAIKVMEREVDQEMKTARMLVGGEIDHPLLQFVASEAHKVQPALLQLAPPHGWLEVNGFRITSAQAAAFEKAARQQIARDRAAAIENGWIPVVERFREPLGL